MEVIRISSFDGQSIWLDHNTELFEVGNFLGGGAAGNVYECEHMKNHERFALKVLNPLGFKIIAPALLRRCNVVIKGKPLNDNEKGSDQSHLKKDNVWWVVNGPTKQYLACYFSEKQQALKELSLNQCIEVFGMDGQLPDDTENLNMLRGLVPSYPPKYLDFLRKRNKIFREIRNMRKISNHKNVIRLEAVLELIQDSKTTIFLVMELANGGELFDRIKLDCGTREETAKIFFKQLLEGVKHCHDQGVCHRDLKPENLLLQDEGNGTVLKIADFGFSAHFDDPNDINGGNNNNNNNSNGNNMNGSTPRPNSGNLTSAAFASPVSKAKQEENPLRVLKSIVGSPFYVAPEVMQSSGYDGTKVDVWSLGVILYAMLAGNLPFGQDLTTCKRFRHFCKWVKDQTAAGVKFWDDPNIEYPAWLFPAKFSCLAKGLIVAMLHPDPAQRITVEEAMRHPLVGMSPMSTPPQQQHKQSSTPLFASPAVTTSSQSASPVVPQHKQQSPPPHPPAATASATNSDNSAVHHEQMEIDQPEPLEMARSHQSSNQSHHSRGRSGDYEDEIMFKMEEDEEEDTAERKEQQSESRSADYSPVVSSSDVSSSRTHESQGKFIQIPHQNPNQTNPSPGQTSYNCSSSFGSMKTMPVVPQAYLTNNHPVRELIVQSPEEAEANDDAFEVQSPMARNSHHNYHNNSSTHSNGAPYGASIYRQDSDSSESRTIPSFSDRVKRSTRFITSVPADEVLTKIESILQEVRQHRIETPAGFIARVELNWEYYRLEVYGQYDIHQPICALQLYQLPANQNASTSSAIASGTGSPSVNYYVNSPSQSYGSWMMQSHLAGGQPMAPPPQLMVEFIRGSIEIFAFKRFYQWVRIRLSELVKKDYAMSFFEQAASPVFDRMMYNRYHQINS